MDSQDLSIESKLRQAWRQEQRYYNMRGISRLIVWIITLLVLDFLIDWGLFAKTGMTGNVGILLLLVNFGVLAWVLWFEWLRYLRAYDPVVVSLEVERRHPGLTSLLVSYTQLKDSDPESTNVSTELIGAMKTQAISESQSLDFKQIVDFGQLRKLFLMASSVFIIFAVLSITWNDHAAIFLKRLAGSTDGYPTETVIKGVTKEVVVRIGDPATIRTWVDPDKVIPAKGRIFTRSAASEDDPWKELPMDPVSGQEGTFARSLKGITEDLIYHVRVGDARSKEHRIRVIAAPQLVATNLTLQYPGYMNLEDGTSDQLTLEVPERTTVKWSLKCDPPVNACEVAYSVPATEGNKEGRATMEAHILDNGTRVEFELKADRTVKYTFKWTEKEQGFQYDDVQYAIKVAGDQLPDVDLVYPSANGVATVNKTLNVVAKASDDYGLREAKFVYSVDGGDSLYKDITQLNGAKASEISYAVELKDILTAEQLKDGTSINYRVEVTDLHPDKDDRIRRTATRQLAILTEKDYLDWYRRELKAQNQKLAESLAAEKESANKVRSIRIEEGDKPSEDEENPEEETPDENNTNGTNE